MTFPYMLRFSSSSLSSLTHPTSPAPVPFHLHWPLSFFMSYTFLTSSCPFKASFCCLMAHILVSRSLSILKYSLPCKYRYIKKLELVREQKCTVCICWNWDCFTLSNHFQTHLPSWNFLKFLLWLNNILLCVYTTLPLSVDGHVGRPHSLAVLKNSDKYECSGTPVTGHKVSCVFA